MKKIVVILLLLLFAASCQKQKEQEPEIILKTDKVEAGSDRGGCRLVQSVKGMESHTAAHLTNMMYFKNDIVVQCPLIDTNTLGKQEIKYRIGNESYPFVIEVVDTTEPEIKLKQEKFFVEKGNEYFDVKNVIDVTDNYDPAPQITFDGYLNVDEIGSYEIMVNAKDSSNNESFSMVTIEVTDKEKEVVVKVETVEVFTEKEAQQSSPINPVDKVDTRPSKPSEATPTKPPVKTAPVSPSKTTQTPKVKQFLFKDGYDFQSAMVACRAYRDQQMKNYIGTGSCDPILENEEYKGYQANFK